MTKKLWIIIFSLCILGCQKSEPIDFISTIGTFYAIENSQDYNYLDLKKDKTYDFVQAKYFSCEFWSQEYGSWDIKKDRLILFQGIDLSPFIKSKKKKNLSTDTLTVNFTNRFLSEFPNIKVRIGLDTFDREIINNQIVLNKKKYSLKNKLFQFSKDDKETNYDRERLEIVLKSDGYFKKTSFILTYGEIEYDLGNFKQEEIPKEKYIEYQKIKEVLISKSNTKWINNHKLEKRKNL